MKINFAIIALFATSVLCVSAQLTAQEGGSLYGTKCALCHGDKGQGKPHLGAKLAGTTKTEAEIVTLLTKGGAAKPPHTHPTNGLTVAQCNQIAAYVKSLK